MPLVTCPDCSRQVSDAAPACPNCGRPAAAGFAPPQEYTRAPAAPQQTRSGFADPAEPAYTGEKAVPVSQARPWVRYFARFLDNVIAVFAVATILAIVAPNYFADESSVYGGTLLALLLWIPVEAAFLSRTGKTPGKALLRTSVRGRDGHLLSYETAFKRSIRVWFFGLGIGFPLVTIFTMLFAYNRLTETGKTSWDDRLGTTVAHGQIGTIRVIVTVSIILAFLALAVVGSA